MLLKAILGGELERVIKCVCIWGESWLGDEQHPYIVSPMPTGWENATVNQLRSVEGNE